MLATKKYEEKQKEMKRYKSDLTIEDVICELKRRMEQPGKGFVRVPVALVREVISFLEKETSEEATKL